MPASRYRPATLGAVGMTKPDVVYAYHPPATIALPAAVLRLLRRVPVVADIQDLWPDTVIETGMMRNAFAISLLNTMLPLGIPADGSSCRPVARPRNAL